VGMLRVGRHGIGTFFTTQMDGSFLFVRKHIVLCDILWIWADLGRYTRGILATTVELQERHDGSFVCVDRTELS
jgi:hypothetical protein